MALSVWQHAAPQEDAHATSTRAGAGSSWMQIGAKSFLGKHNLLHSRNSALRHILGPVEGSVQLGGSFLGQPHVVIHLPFGESENPALLKSVAVWLSQQLAVLKNISLCKLGACWRPCHFTRATKTRRGLPTVTIFSSIAASGAIGPRFLFELCCLED